MTDLVSLVKPPGNPPSFHFCLDNKTEQFFLENIILLSELFRATYLTEFPFLSIAKPFEDFIKPLVMLETLFWKQGIMPDSG